MTNSIRMDSLSLKYADSQKVSRIRNTKAVNFSGVGDKKADNKNTVDTILNISKEAREKLKKHSEADSTFKKAGVTSAREQFEIDALEWKTSRHTFAENPFPWMRLDEPETDAKVEAILRKGTACGGMETEEGFKCFCEASDVMDDWFYRRCFDEAGNFRNPVTGQSCLISELERLYSDSVHDTSFDVYDDSFAEEDATPWRFCTKFNVTMPADLLKDLALLQNMEKLSEEKKQNLQEKMKKVDAAVNHMKEVEKNYEGNLVALRFGVKLDKSANATYYADYADCEEKYGITAETPEELLEKLMSK